MRMCVAAWRPRLHIWRRFTQVMGQEPHTVVLFDGNKVKQVEDQQCPLWIPRLLQRAVGESDREFPGRDIAQLCLWLQGRCIPQGNAHRCQTVWQHRKGSGFPELRLLWWCAGWKGYVPFKDDSKWNTHDDGLDAGFVNPLKTVSKRFSDKPTALGGTTSSSVSGSFYAGVGRRTEVVGKQYNRWFLQLFKRYRARDFPHSLTWTVTDFLTRYISPVVLYIIVHRLRQTTGSCIWWACQGKGHQ